MPSPLIILAKLDAIGVAVAIGAGVLALPLFYLIHCGLTYCCLLHALRFCRKNSLDIVRYKCGPAFNASGLKTECILFELDCLDCKKQRKLIHLLVWVFGIRRVLFNDEYPESCD